MSARRGVIKASKRIIEAGERAIATSQGRGTIKTGQHF